MSSREGLAAAAFAAALSSLPGQVAAQDVLARDLAELSLEELFAQEVSSVAKRPQSVKDAPAAVFVISREDIRRSGAANIPELLRMVPGMEVAQLTSLNAAVTARGFNGFFGSKLLILLDGRHLYSSTIAGVPWNTQLVPVENIERIEVVRGPGATLYGANAVNGVINIITKHAVDTKGSLATGEVYDDGSHRITLRQGLAVGENGTLRLSANLRQYHGRARLGPESARNDHDHDHHHDHDHAHGEALSFRYDVEPSAVDALTLQGDLIHQHAQVGEGEESSTVTRNLLARWTHTPAAGQRTSLQAYAEQARVKLGPTTYRGATYDFDFSQQLSLGRHDVVYGLGYRRVELTSGSDPLGLPKISEDWFGGFIQDEVRLAGDRLKVSAGVKVERHPRTGFEAQPSLRAIWMDPDGWSTWAAISRAVRTPSNLETDSTLDARPFFLLLPGDVDPEVVVAAEAGWRGRVADQVSLDLAVFHNWYEQLIGLRSGFETLNGRPTRVTRPASVGSAKSYGLEGSLEARITERWSLEGALTLQEVKLATAPSTTFVFFSPTQSHSPNSQFSLRSMMDLRDDLDLDFWLRRVSNLSGGAGQAYNDLDFRMAWRATPYLELVLKGENLLRDERIEFAPVFGPAAIVSRRVALGVTWRR